PASAASWTSREYCAVTVSSGGRIIGLSLASDGGAPAPRRPAARPAGLSLASDGGAPAPRRPAARPAGLSLASDGGAPAPRRPAARSAEYQRLPSSRVSA